MVIGLQPGLRGSTLPGSPPWRSVIALKPGLLRGMVIAPKPGLHRGTVMALKPGLH